MEMLVATVQIDIITILTKWALFFFFAKAMNDGLISALSELSHYITKATN